MARPSLFFTPIHRGSATLTSNLAKALLLTPAHRVTKLLVVSRPYRPFSYPCTQGAQQITIGYLANSSFLTPAHRDTITPLLIIALNSAFYPTHSGAQPKLLRAPLR